MTEKVLVTSKKALRSKYGSTGWAAIEGAVAALVAADKKRGITTRLVCLDLKGDVQPFGPKPVSDPADQKGTKAAIDAIFKTLSPAYLVLLGAPDVVAHQSLTNPLQDEDPEVPSDLPYACEAPFGKRIEDFKGPTRVVSRLPDVAGSKDPGYLLALLKEAAGWKSRQARSYKSYFAVSAAVWKGSTRLSVKKLFGSTKKLALAPPRGPEWSKTQLGARSHFINLHGALEDDRFYGENGGDFPEAHFAGNLPGKLRDGTVVAAECCYGAELFDPAPLGLHMGIANTYLGNGAFGFFGSTTVAYGPADGNGAADLICQTFIREIQNGASIGRAGLTARQEYVTGAAPLDPIDLKTLGQFLVLGDASVHPATAPAKTRKTLRAKSLASPVDRRKSLFSKGRRIAATTAAVASRPGGKVEDKLRSALIKLAAAHELDFGKTIRRFAIRGASRPALARGFAAKSRAAGGGSYLLMYAKSKGKRAMARKGLEKGLEKSKPASRQVIGGRRAVLVAREDGGKITSVQTYHPR